MRAIGGLSDGIGSCPSLRGRFSAVKSCQKGDLRIERITYLTEAPSTGLGACLRAPSRDLDALLDLACCLLLPATVLEVGFDPEEDEVVVPFIVNTERVQREISGEEREGSNVGESTLVALSELSAQVNGCQQ